MSIERLMLNRGIVFGFAVLYWSGVWVQAKRVRRHIGRSPNIRPRSPKEKLLWVGWCFVVVSWLALPWLARSGTALSWARVIPSLVHPLSLGVGTAMMAAGYALTLWCYVAMGDEWRMGVNPKEKIHLVINGPYRFTRHPIYLSQLLMVIAIVLLLPSAISLLMVAIHLLCVLVKAADEESYLRTQLGQAYELYHSRTGWFPRFLRRKPATSPLPTLDRDVLKPIEPPLK